MPPSPRAHAYQQSAAAEEESGRDVVDLLVGLALLPSRRGVARKFFGRHQDLTRDQ